ncbi:MAG: MFS family permease [Verrucomicrobiales bacterium]|jgi:MFS family permease
MNAEERSRRMFRMDLQRALPTGILETVGATFAVLILERCYAAGSYEKALVVSSPNIGLVLSIISVDLLRRWPENRTAAGFSFAAGFVLIFTVLFSSSISIFVVTVMLAMIAFGGQAPLVTALYRHNYPAHRRGQLFGIVGIARGVCSVGFGWAGGQLLEADPGHFRLLMAVFAGMAIYTGICLLQMPSPPAASSHTLHRRNPLQALRWLKKDPLFRRLLIAWMWAGMAVLSLCSLTVEYLANPRYHWNFPSGKIAMITIVVPVLFRLATTFFWGFAFDKVNFFILRIVLNFAFGFSLLAFYVGQSEVFLWVGMALRGIAMGGGNIAWNLWVTKLAPAERVSEYMSVHTFLTGVRGIIGPPLAFWLITFAPVSIMAWTGFGMLIISSLLILPHVRTATLQE